VSASPTGATTPQKAVLKQSVTLFGASDNNDALSIPVPVGAPLSLTLIVKEPPAGHPRGELRILPFSSGELPPAIAAAKIRTGESNTTATTPAGDSVSVTLDKQGQITFVLDVDRLHPGKTYKGYLVLISGDLAHRWEITLITGGRGIVAVDPVGTLKFVTFPCFCGAPSFSFTLYDKTEGGPYHHVRARFEPSASANSKALTSNFNLDTFSFWENGKRVDLERRNAGAPELSGAAITLAKARTFTARVQSLSPGEYSGALRFAADEASDDAAEAKLPLLIQVRHHWLLPVFVIVIGSAFGWFTSKYVIGKRKARDLSQQVKEARARLDFLARPSTRIGWQFPSEAGSLGFARLGVELKRLAKLTASAIEVVFHGDEIEQLRQRAELRLKALESLSKARLRVQPVADGRPAAQHAIGLLLRSATDLLERPTFGELEQASLSKILEAVETWANAATFVAAYQQALLERRRSNEFPGPEGVNRVASGPVGPQLKTLFDSVPTEEEISAQTTPSGLKDFDEKIARIALLWRDHDQPWAKDLAEADAASKPLDDLYRTVDTCFWDTTLKTAAANRTLVVERSSVSEDKPQTYEVVEMDLTSQGLEVRRIRRHPLRVVWRIKPRVGDARTTETDGLTLVQYFPSAGSVSINAFLRWDGKEIAIEPPLSIDVAQNPEYHKSWRFATEWTEYAAIGVAALFAIVTAMGSQYDSTFGSFTQYLTMFVWAAGAGTGGNLFSQLGATSAPGGAAATAAPGGAPAAPK
jgi:hypothetical protein